jgi:8-oxo-dGTP pyrophosphatase MutT (NUDIX family)
MIDATELRRRFVPAPREALTEEASAAVASVVRNGAAGLELLFIERAEREGDPWSGHLAFPGGKRETADESLLHTAVRETEEEVGLLLPHAALAGRLADVTARSSGYRVAQYVFTLDDPEVTLVTNAEVAATLWCPVDRLVRREGAGTIPYVRAGQAIALPCLRWDGYVLWGITYRMAMQLVAAASLDAE